MAYKLKQGVYLVKGSSNAALLDTNSGNVYSINSTGYSVLSYSVENDAYWQKLVGIGLAELSATNEPTQLPTDSNETRLNFVWFEIISDRCNEACLHCYGCCLPKQKGNYQHLTIPASTGRKLTFEEWKKCIEGAYNLGCRRGQLIGGEPLLYKGENGETVLDLADFMVKLGYTFVEIYTNGTLLTPDKIKRIKALNLHVAVSLYSLDSAVHDLITQTPGSHKLTKQAITWLKDAGVPTRVEIVLMRQNQQTIDQTLLYRDSLGVGGSSPDPLRPSGRGENASLLPDIEYLARFGLRLKPNFKTSRKALEHNQRSNSCLDGKITITDTGNVLPCIFARKHVLGNVVVSSLQSIITSMAVKVMWRSTKDNVLVCKDCEFRYCCFDCRLLAETSVPNTDAFFTAPDPRCTYNPYTGEWAAGIWRLNEKGVLVYDRTDANVFRLLLADNTVNRENDITH